MHDDGIRGRLSTVFHVAGSVCHHISLYERGEADGPTIAKLFDAAARRIEAIGPLFVRHVALDTTDDAQWSETSLTVYYDLDNTAPREPG